MKTSLLDPAGPPDGTEEIPVLQGIGETRELVRMPAGALASAATKPTPAELQAAILATLVEGGGISFTLDEGAGTVTIAVDVAALVTATQLTDGLATKQASSALLTSLAGLAINLNGGKVIKVKADGTGFELADDEAGTGGGGALVDGTYGDVIISGGGTVFTVTIAADEAYGAGWNADKGPPTKNAVYAKLEAMAATIAGKVATTSVGVANGVASLDSGGKVPAGQLPSYVDDVLEYASASAFPNPGETGKIYLALDTGRQSRWSGSAYVELTASPGTTDAVPEGATNKYYTDVRVRAALMTGLLDTVGTPAATDSLLTVLGKLKRQAFTIMPQDYLAKAGGNMTGNLTLLGGTIVGRDAADTVEYGRATFGVNGAYLRGSKINFQNVAGTQLGTVDAAGNYISVGWIRGITGGSLAGAPVAGLEAYSDGTAGNGAWLAFHRAGTQAIYAGLDTDNKFKIGGWSWTGAKLTLDSTGKLTVPDNCYAKDFYANRGDGTGVIYFGDASKYLYFDGTNYSLPSAGLTVGGFGDFISPNAGTTGGIRIRQNGTYAYLQVTNAAASAELSYLRWSGNGDLYHSAAFIAQGNISSLSDRRLKKNVRPLKRGLELVKAMRGVRYVMKAEPARQHVGVIAQELEAVVPELVSTDGDGIKAVDYGKLTAVLIEAIKEISVELDALKAARA